MITKNSQPLSQLARRLGENSGEQEKAFVENKIIYNHKYNSGPSFKDFFQYKQLVCKYGILSSIEPINCVIKKNHDIILICNILIKDQEKTLIGKQVLEKKITDSN